MTVQFEHVSFTPLLFRTTGGIQGMTDCNLALLLLSITSPVAQWRGGFNAILFSYSAHRSFTFVALYQMSILFLDFLYPLVCLPAIHMLPSLDIVCVCWHRQLQMRLCTIVLQLPHVHCSIYHQHHHTVQGAWILVSRASPYPLYTAIVQSWLRNSRNAEGRCWCVRVHGYMVCTSGGVRTPNALPSN